MFDILVHISTVINKNNENNSCIADMCIEIGAARYILLIFQNYWIGSLLNSIAENHKILATLKFDEIKNK